MNQRQKGGKQSGQSGDKARSVSLKATQTETITDDLWQSCLPPPSSKTEKAFTLNHEAENAC